MDDPWREFEENYITTKNGRLFYRRRRSDGKSILFLHGIGADSRTWRPLIDYIPKELDVYMVDLLGHGRSDMPDIDYNVMLQVQTVEEFISKLEISNPVLFGHSYGSWISVLYSLENRVDSLMLEDSAGLEEVFKHFSEPEATAYKEMIFKETTKIGANPKVMRSTIDNSYRDMLTDDVLSRVTYRTLILWGSNDTIVDVSLAEKMHSMIKDSDLFIVEGADHQPHRSKPEIVGSAMTKFINYSSVSS